MLEGVLHYEVKLLLRHLISEETLCTLNQLNNRIETFNYGYRISKDKPSAISDSRLNSDGNRLGQSGNFVRSSLLDTKAVRIQ